MEQRNGKMRMKTKPPRSLMKKVGLATDDDVRHLTNARTRASMSNELHDSGNTYNSTDTYIRKQSKDFIFDYSTEAYSSVALSLNDAIT